jgi:8-oxo-dGTP pyrophosphatase MutT (NUDIX family)
MANAPKPQPALLRRLVRRLMRMADRVRRKYWRLRGKTILGVMAKAYTPDGALLLVRQTYSSGWHLPGGGRSGKEPPVEAALRELREEIGLQSWSEARLQCSVHRRLSGVAAVVDVVEVRDVVHLFRPSLEIEEVGLFDPRHLPRDLNDWTRDILKEAGAP